MNQIITKAVSASLVYILRNSDKFATKDLRWHSSPGILSMKIAMLILYFIISVTDYEKQYIKEKLHGKTKQHYKCIYHFGGASLGISPKCQRSAEVGEKKLILLVQVRNKHWGTPKSFSAGLLSNHSPPSLYWYWRLPRPRCRTLHLALLNLMRFTPVHFSSLWRPLWMASLPCSVSTAPLSSVLSADLLRLHSIPQSTVVDRDIK